MAQPNALLEAKVPCPDTLHRNWNGKMHFFDCECKGTGQVPRFPELLGDCPTCQGSGTLLAGGRSGGGRPHDDSDGSRTRTARCSRVHRSHARHELADCRSHRNVAFGQVSPRHFRSGSRTALVTLARSAHWAQLRRGYDRK